MTGASRYLLPWLALVPLLAGCRSIPAPDVSISPKSSLLAVDVLYPYPRSRDPSLVQVFFVRGPIDGGLAELPELIPASFVKRSRAYLLDPEPGTYSLVAVSSEVAPPWNHRPVAGGVTQTVLNEEIGHVVIFSADLIQRTKTTVRSGDVAFMGALRVRRSDRINASAVLQDDLQQRIAERIRPGSTSRSGLAGSLSMTWMVDLEATSISNDASDRESFVGNALADLDDSPWARVIARAGMPEATTESSRTPEPEPGGTAANPGNAASKPQVAVPGSRPAKPEPSGSPPAPKRRAVAGIPPDSPLAKIEIGMHHSEVRKILGDPDQRIDRLTAKAWIPFYGGPGARLIDWIYAGIGRVVFSQQSGFLEVFDVIHDPGEPK